MAEDTITLKFTGYHVSGNAHVLLWDGTEADVCMTPFKVQDKADIPKYVNDGKFGCETILSAECHVSRCYQGFLVFDEVLDFDRKQINQNNRGVLGDVIPKDGWREENGGKK